MSEIKEGLDKEVIDTLKTIYDPEIPVNIYDLGLIYNLDYKELPKVEVLMTFTSPSCPMSDVLIYQVENRLKLIDGIDEVNVEITFDPLWDKENISEEGQLKLGFL